MSTRGFYVFKKGNESFNVYKHMDNYPTGGADALAAAGKFAWELPRFEPDEYGAAFIAANKGHSGNLRLAESGDWQSVAPSDIEYVYIVEGVGSDMNSKVTVTCYDVDLEDWQAEKRTWKTKKVFSKPLKTLIAGWRPAE